MGLGARLEYCLGLGIKISREPISVLLPGPSRKMCLCVLSWLVANCFLQKMVRVLVATAIREAVAGA
ncbi:hypothetical protein SDJN03_15074, partial [Cucurbita argyrosperma subsp. sororia]